MNTIEAKMIELSKRLIIDTHLNKIGEFKSYKVQCGTQDPLTFKSRHKMLEHVLEWLKAIDDDDAV